jgi:radical SAM superfamily enzyme YgiQ (UPF0313 family)
LIDEALTEIERLPGRHLYFLDDHLFGSPRFAASLFEGMCGMDRLWQAAGTVQSVLHTNLIEIAAASGLRSLFVGFESLSFENLRRQNKRQNLGQDYIAAIRRLHDLGVMVNASFVFGMDEDDESVFEHTVEWAIRQGIETATFHILTPYPGTNLHARMQAEKWITSLNWDLYDTRHAVFQPRLMSPAALEAGYWRAYHDFYRWGSIVQSARNKRKLAERLRHLSYAGGWKKFERLWDIIIRMKRISNFLPLLEGILNAGEEYVTEEGKIKKHAGLLMNRVDS